MKPAAHILVVVPGALFRRELGSLLTGAGYTVELNRSLEDATRILGAGVHDLVVVEPDLATSDGETQFKALCKATIAPVVGVLVDQTRGETTAEQGRRAKAAGARDFVHRTARPGSSVEMGPLLLRKLTQLRLPSASRISQPPRTPIPRRSDPSDRGPKRPASEPSAPVSRAGIDRFPIFLIGCSTGGPNALEVLLKSLPSNFPAALVVSQHMRAAATSPFVKRLEKQVDIDVQEVRDTAILAPGTCYVAAGGADLVFVRKRSKFAVCSVPADPALPFHPSVDRMVRSAAEHVPIKRLRSVLLTGIGQDGAESMAELFSHGVPTIAESEETCVVFGMPARLIDRCPAAEVQPIGKIGSRLQGMLDISKVAPKGKRLDDARTKLAQLAQRTGKEK